MRQDDEFEPKLGKIRSRSLPRSTFLREVQQTIGRASGLYRRISGRTSRFEGSRISRGTGTGRLLASRDRYSALRGRRVVIKARLIRLGASNLNGAKAHLRYLQRDGVTREDRIDAIVRLACQACELSRGHLALADQPAKRCCVKTDIPV